MTEFLQKQGMSSVANRLMRKRESGGGQQNFSRPGTIQEKLDVVGLIRVVDNPDDLEYFGRVRISFLPLLKIP